MEMPKDFETWLKSVSKHGVNGNVQFAKDGGVMLMLDCWECGGLTLKVSENTVELVASKPSSKMDVKEIASSDDPMSIEE